MGTAGARASRRPVPGLAVCCLMTQAGAWWRGVPATTRQGRSNRTSSPSGVRTHSAYWLTKEDLLTKTMRFAVLAFVVGVVTFPSQAATINVAAGEVAVSPGNG